MSKKKIAALLVCAALSLPALAADPDRTRGPRLRDEPPIRRFVKAVKKFVVGSLYEITIPTPAPKP